MNVGVVGRMGTLRGCNANTIQFEFRLKERERRRFEAQRANNLIEFERGGESEKKKKERRKEEEMSEREEV